MSGQIVPDQNQAEWWQRHVWHMSQPGCPVRCSVKLGRVGRSLGQSGQDVEQLMLEPGVQDDIWSPGDTFGTYLARRRPEQRQQFGGATTDVLVRLRVGVSLRLPGLTGLRNRLIRTSLVLAPQRDAHLFGDVIGQVDQPLFFSVSGSTTVTTPDLRLRWAVPVGHQVRVRWKELPASCSTRRIVLVPTRDNPAPRKLRWRVVSDQVAVPSVRRFG